MLAITLAKELLDVSPLLVSLLPLVRSGSFNSSVCSLPSLSEPLAWRVRRRRLRASPR